MAAGFVFLLAGHSVLAGATPLIELKFGSGTGTSLTNTGTAGGSATLTGSKPTFSSNTPINGGPYSLDFGTSEGDFAADITASSAVNALKNLKSFTLTGWVNCRSSATNTGGGRIISWYNNGAQGVDLAFLSDGRLGLGVNQWNDHGGVTSNPAKISVDANGSYNNWRFFAVTYDETLTAKHVKFYFGTNHVPASLDREVDYDQGAAGSQIVSSLAIGNVNAQVRDDPFTSVLRGLIDQIRIYGSTTSGSGALSLQEIQDLQQAMPLAAQAGVVHERWDNITGAAVSNLLADSRYPNNPSATTVRAAFEAPRDQADNFGVRMSGWVKAPETGNYIFWIVSDDGGELRLSTDANPVNKRLIASVDGYVGYDNWTQNATQQSAPIPLQAGQHYYLEALMKEGGGSDHLRVGWKLPSGAEERPIPESRLSTTPPESDMFYPSAITLYEPGTTTKKAVLGWRKETGRDRFYIEAEDAESMSIRNGTVIVPDRLFFGGRFPGDPNQNDLGFRWDRPTVDDIGILHLETQGGRWALQVESGSEMEPNVIFNEIVTLEGPDQTDAEGTWSGFATIHNLYGAAFLRRREESDPSNWFRETSTHNGNGLIVVQESELWGIHEKATSQMAGGMVEVHGKDPLGPDSGVVKLTREGLRYEVKADDVLQSQTVIDWSGLSTTHNIVAEEIHASAVVTTPKWRIPDYVFEKDYQLRSLEETERFVREKKHLPDIPSAREISGRGLDLAEMNLKLLKTVEEMTLHMIAMDKELKVQRQGYQDLMRQMRALQAGGKGN